MKPPAFQFYPDDFLAGTMTMTLEERGAYITLLCIQWSQGSVTADDMSRVYGSAIDLPLAKRVTKKFDLGEDGNYRNARLEHERAKQAAFRQKKSNSGKKGAESRWNDGNAIVLPLANGMATGMANDGSPSPSPSPSPEVQSTVLVKSPDSTPQAQSGKGARRARPAVSSQEIIAKYSADPTYQGIDVHREFGKMVNWCGSRNKRPTEGRFVNWLNRVEVALAPARPRSSDPNI